MKYIYLLLLLFSQLCIAQTKTVHINHDRSYPDDSILTYKDGKLNGDAQLYHSNSSGTFLQTLVYKNGVPTGTSKLIDCNKGIIYKINFNNAGKPDTVLLPQKRILLKHRSREYHIGLTYFFDRNDCLEKLDRKYGLKKDRSFGCVWSYRKSKKVFKHNLKANLYLARRNGVNWRDKYEMEYKECPRVGF